MKARHLIPLVSWVWLRARCAYCRESIHWQYPVVEAVGAIIGITSLSIITGDTWSFSVISGSAWLLFAFTLLLQFALLVITAFDLRWQLVPIPFTLGMAVVLGSLRVFLGGASAAVPTLVGALGTAAALGVIVLVSRGAMMGEGDPAVGLLLGAALGSPLAFAALYLAFVIGGAVAAALLLAGRVTRKTPVPFVPFLAVGTVMAYWWQAPILAQLSYVF